VWIDIFYALTGSTGMAGTMAIDSTHVKAHGSAAGDYVWAHVNFLNLFNDDPNDTAITGVDIYKMDADGKAVEHWDTLQFVGDPNNSAPLIGPNIPRANPNGMF
jgi:predicted SnoaL-like aldol condensation-catalyzing enzyme